MSRSHRDEAGAGASERDDDRWMDRALALAEQARATSPNPMVGALVVTSRGEVAGRGFTAPAGGPHAEVRALEEAGERARGATLYCTLEPCCHVGRTGPCVHRIADAGIGRVVVAVIDPNPRVNGGGVAYLRGCGIQVDVGVRRRHATRLNEAFITWVTTGRPFVTMKVAVSRDGKIAARKGSRTPITSKEANQVIHAARARADCLGVGSETVIVDDPQLTVRGYPRERPLTRVVFDRRLRTSAEARLFQTTGEGPVWILTTSAGVAAHPHAVERLRSSGARIEVIEDDRLSTALRRLGELEVTSLILEGGAAIHRAAWREGLVDRVHRFQAPLQLGPQGVPWIGDEVTVEDLFDVRVEACGPDELMEGYVQRID